MRHLSSGATIAPNSPSGGFCQKKSRFTFSFRALILLSVIWLPAHAQRAGTFSGKTSSPSYATSASVSSVTCNNNGTLTTASDDYLTFLLNPDAPVAAYEAPYTYTVTATQNGSPVGITLSDGSPATSVLYGRTQPFRTNGIPGAGNVVLTITPDWGSYPASQVTVTDPGSCVVGNCSFGPGSHTLTYTYQSPVQLTDAVNWQTYIPKFQESGGRNLTGVQVNIGSTHYTSMVIENGAPASQTYTASVQSNLVFSLGGSPIATPLLTPYQSAAPITVGPAVLVPAQGTWTGDDMINGKLSTVWHMANGSAGWLMDALNVGQNPLSDPRWVTNATGDPATDDDISLDGILKTGNYSGAFTYSSAADLAKFTGTGQVPLTYSTLSGYSVVGGGGNLSIYLASSTFFTVSVTYTFSELCPLPVRLASFKATGANGTAVLDWVTLNEQNSKGFFVEQSADTKSWESIAWVGSKAAAGNSDARLAYHYTDQKPTNPASYYRLKMMDLDGTYTYSQVVSVETGPAVRLSIYPNPASSRVTIGGVAPGQIREAALYDLSGKMILRSPAPGTGSLSVETLSAGFYLLTVTDLSGRQYQTKLVVRR